MAKSPVKVDVKIKDKGATKKSIRDFFGKKHVAVKVGVFGPAADEIEEGSNYTVAQIAEVHEFGLGHVPERSFLRAYLDENEDRLIRALLLLLQAQVKAAVARGSKVTITEQTNVLNKLGLFMVGEIQKRISARIAPVLADETIRRKTINGKAGDVPLINTGQLRASITHLAELGK
jgi:hypothetical protein